MPSLERSAFLPVSNLSTTDDTASITTTSSISNSLASTLIPNRIRSRLKVLSGNAGRDEVSSQHPAHILPTTNSMGPPGSVQGPGLGSYDMATPAHPSGILRIRSRETGQDAPPPPVRQTTMDPPLGASSVAVTNGTPISVDQPEAKRTGSDESDVKVAGGVGAKTVKVAEGVKGDRVPSYGDLTQLAPSGNNSEEAMLGQARQGGTGDGDDPASENQEVALPPIGPAAGIVLPGTSPRTDPMNPISPTTSNLPTSPTSPSLRRSSRSFSTSASPPLLARPGEYPLAPPSPFSPVIAPSTLAGSVLRTIQEHDGLDSQSDGINAGSTAPDANYPTGSGSASGTHPFTEASSTPSPAASGMSLEEPPPLRLDRASLGNADETDSTTIKEGPEQMTSSNVSDRSVPSSRTASISESIQSNSNSTPLSRTDLSLGPNLSAGLGGAAERQGGRRLPTSSSRLSSKALSVAGKLKDKITGGSTFTGGAENGYAALSRNEAGAQLNGIQYTSNGIAGSGTGRGFGAGSGTGLHSLFGSLGNRNRSLKLGRSASLPVDRADAGLLTSSFFTSDSRAFPQPARSPIVSSSIPMPDADSISPRTRPTNNDSAMDATSPLLLPMTVAESSGSQSDELFKTGMARSAGNRSSTGSIDYTPNLSTSPTLAPSPSLSGALAALGLKSGSSDHGSRGRRGSRPDEGLKPDEAKSGRTRSRSPFFSRSRKRIVDLDAIKSRDNSPDGGPVPVGEDSDGESVVSNSSSMKFRPSGGSNFDSKRPSSYAGSEADDESDESDGESEYDDGRLSKEYTNEHGDIEDVFDETTEANTEANAAYTEGDASFLANGDDNEVELDVTGEGPNVVRQEEPDFPLPSQMRRPAPSETADGAVRKSNQPERLELVTGRPEYGRNNCTIRMTNGDPDEALERLGNRLRSYVVLSDLSQESNIAMTWALDTVARDGDEVFVINVIENEAKVDPKDLKNFDRAAKIKVQKERQTIALLLAKQVTGLLQRTQLNITVTCQAIHSKNARHMLLDLIDHIEPTMVIVGSRGLGKLKGIILGSTSRYLIEKSSVPVMVARRRLRAPLRKTDPATLRHAPRTSLASASIEKSASSKQEDEGLDAADIEAEEDEKDAAEAARAKMGGRS